MSDGTYSIWIFGKYWPEHGALMLDGLSTEAKAVAIIKTAMKNDDRIEKAEVWVHLGNRCDRVFTKIRERNTA